MRTYKFAWARTALCAILEKVSSTEEPVTIILLGDDGSALQDVRSALETRFPRAKFARCASLGAVPPPTRGFVEILVIADRSDADRDVATTALDEEELPRWVVLDLARVDNNRAGRLIPIRGMGSEALVPLIELGVERHRLLRQTERMRGDLQTIGSRMCHDLRTPLTCLQTFVFIATASREAAIPEDLVSSASTSAEELALLVDRVATIGKSWSTPSEPVTVDMQEAFNQGWYRVSRRFPDHGIRLQAPTSLPSAMGVRQWIEAVWEICLAEAVLHAPRGSEVSVRAPDSDDLPSCRFELWIPGVDRREWGMEPFHLLHARRDRGSVSLSLARRLLRDMGGECEQKQASSGAEGVCLRFTLPAPSGAAVPKN